MLRFVFVRRWNYFDLVVMMFAYYLFTHGCPVWAIVALFVGTGISVMCEKELDIT